MIRSCLSGLVGIKGRCETINLTSQYIDDLPNISSKFLELLTADWHNDADKVFEKVERRGIDNFYQKIISAYAEKKQAGASFILKSLLSQVETGTWYQPFETLSLESKWVGTRLYMQHSDNLEMHVETIEIYNASGSPVVSEIKVFDLERGTELDSISYTAPANAYYIIDVFKRYHAKKILVAYDKAAIQSRRTKGFGLGYYHKSCEPCGSFLSYGNYVEVDKASQVIDLNMAGNSTGGMVVKYSVGCSLEPWICRMKTYLAPILRYQIGLELFMELIGSSRVNEITSISPNEYNLIMNYFDKNLTEGVNNFVLSNPIQDSICTECIAPAKRTAFIP